MYLLIPLTLILASAIGIFVIVWRKRPYLEKLYVTEVKSESSVWSDLFPELEGSLNGSKLKHYRGIWLLELEKFLRRLRVVSMKMDRASDSWIKKIRSSTEKKHPKVHTEASGIEKFSIARTPEQTRQDLIEESKREEQRLIIEIAKNPKNSALYESLGDLYVKMGNLSDAKESYEAAIELNPAKEELVKKRSQTAENVVS